MHHAQVNHTDLNIHNILIDDSDKVWIIDFDKCYQQSGDVGSRATLIDLSDRLKRKWLAIKIHWHDAELKVLLEGYKNAT